MTLFNPIPKQHETSNTPQAVERFERKFYLPSSAIPFAAHLLKHCCPPDRQYPCGTIHSVYYDTADLDHLDESEQGSRIRHKIRIRWYDSPQDGSAVRVFLELKSRNGFAGRKQRKEQTVSAKHLQSSVMRDGLLPYGHIVNTLTEFGYHSSNRLYPVILVTYQRLRFADILTGARVSLDWNIQSRLVNPMLNRGEGLLRMEGGVIEIKGKTCELPVTLQSLGLLGTDWSRYSKYASCLRSHLDMPGSFGRLTPSGRGEIR